VEPMADLSELIGRNKKKGGFEAKKKTELCKNFIEGFCKYGDDCAFAHGVEEC